MFDLKLVIMRNLNIIHSCLIFLAFLSVNSQSLSPELRQICSVLNNEISKNMGIQKTDQNVSKFISKSKLRKNIKQFVLYFKYLDNSKNNQITFYQNANIVFYHQTTITNDERYLYYSSLSPPINS
jgi:hypothetical protein